MWSLCLARFVSALIAILGVITIVFLLIHLVPGDPVEVMLGESSHGADRVALHHALGLDRPLVEQWFAYLCDLLRFDFGSSLYSQRPIAEILRERIPATAALALGGLCTALLIAVPLGVAAALKRGTYLDRIATGIAVLGISVPNFWMGPLLVIVFAIWLGWVPVAGYSGPSSLVLPSLTLGTALAAILSRMIRTTVLDVIDEDFTRAARAKGLGEAAILWRHVAPNAALPILTVVGIQLGGLLGGAVITETIFAWPGLGRLSVEAIMQRDYPVLQACVLLISITYVLVNALTDVMYAMIDPRIRARP